MENNNIKVFENSEFGKLQVIEINGKPYFPATDCARILGYTNPQKTIRDHCKGVNESFIPTNGGNQLTKLIPEGDLYRLIVRSKLPSAERFERWVFDEVLPSIRENSGYIMGQEEISETELMAKALLVAQKTLVNREARLAKVTAENEVMKPKAEYFDDLVDRNTLTNFRETAKEFNIPQKEFISFLMDNNYIYRDKRGRLMPYANKDDGLFEVKECKSNNSQWSGTQMLLTSKGRETFRLLLRVNENTLVSIEGASK